MPLYATIIKTFEKGKMTFVSLVAGPRDAGFTLHGFPLGWQKLTQQSGPQCASHYAIFYRKEHLLQNCSKDL